ncbi:MAG: DUF2569 family protein [Bacteroidetes bacterium]|nr:DUF2569 family protein [Bacteroidota bacterium]
MFENTAEWEGTCVLNGSLGTCFKCKKTFEITNQDIASKNFICSECKASNKIIVVDETLVGIKGWLLFFSICLVLSLMSAFANLGEISIFQDNLDKNSVPYNSIFLNIAFMVRIIVFLYLSYVHYLFFSKNIKFRKEFNKYIFFTILAVIFSNLLLYSSITSSIYYKKLSDTSSNILSSTIINIITLTVYWVIWSSYFRKSKRFMNTFFTK